MKELMSEYPNGGIVFCDCKNTCPISDLLVTDGPFGATEVIPREGEIFSFDWNIDEYKDTDTFLVYGNEDILQMICTLTKEVKHVLKDWWED